MHILFVCTGNICRSPMAEGLFRHMVEETDDLFAESAGVMASPGMPASHEAVQSLRSMGIDISHHQSRRIDPDMVDRADFIFGMTSAHLDNILKLYPHVAEKLFLVREFDEETGSSSPDVPDPIGRGQAVYDECRDMLDSVMPGIIRFVRQSQNSLSVESRSRISAPTGVIVYSSVGKPEYPDRLQTFLRQNGYAVRMIDGRSKEDDIKALEHIGREIGKGDVQFGIMLRGQASNGDLQGESGQPAFIDAASGIDEIKKTREIKDVRILAFGQDQLDDPQAGKLVDTFLTSGKTANESRRKKNKESMSRETPTIGTGILAQVDPEVAEAIAAEELRQQENIELIASENFTSEAVMAAQGSVLTNKYAEGYPGKRWYGGCENVDVVEQLAIDRAKELFGAEHVNVQPHSGSQANMAVYFSVLDPGDKILTMDLAHGGHLTHGHPANFSGRLYEVSHYGVSEKDEQIDYDALAKQAEKFKPKMITVGASAYSMTIDFARMREIADSVDAYLFADMAHIAGLVAGGVHPSPIPHADFVTSTTHKSLRGPRGGIILCKEEYAKKIDSRMFPGVQGGPLMHVIAAKAVCFHEALQPGFKEYAAQVVSNAKALAVRLGMNGFRIVSGGTENHVMLVDLRGKDMSGRDAQEALDKAGITVNKNAIPFDTMPIMQTGGIRIGTPAVTTRGMKEEEMMDVADLITEALDNREDGDSLDEVRERVVSLTSRFPLP